MLLWGADFITDYIQLSRQYNNTYGILTFMNLEDNAIVFL